MDTSKPSISGIKNTDIKKENNANKVQMTLNEKWKSLDQIFKRLLQKAIERCEKDLFMQHCAELDFSEAQSHLLHSALDWQQIEKHSAFQKQQFMQSTSSQKRSYYCSQTNSQIPTNQFVFLKPM